MKVCGHSSKGYRNYERDEYECRSHGPLSPDKVFLDLCDSLGLFVRDELTGWQAAYDTIIGRKLVKDLVLRDVNQPSIVIWYNGNEGG